jgi:hypothetical protein
MTERLQQPRGSGSRTARRRMPRAGLWGARTIPAATAKRLVPEDEPTLLGFPAEFAEPADPAGLSSPDVGPEAPSGPGLVVLRRADRVGGGALVLAGAAANVSLSLSWSPGEGPTGLSLVQSGVETLRFGEWALTSLWQPFVVVAGGGLLVLLGILLLVPAHAHRLVGVLALAVSLAAAVAVALLINDVGWDVDRLGPGMWCAVAVPVLGVVGALKAMLTPPLVALGSRRGT